MKKFLVVTPYFYPKIGGAENYAYNISKGLKKYGWEIVVVTSNHEANEYKEETLEGMKVYRLPRQFKISNTPISFKWKKQIKEIIKEEKPNVINAHTPVPFISDVTSRIAHKLKIPFVLTYHAGSMKKERSIFNLLIWIYENIFLKRTLDNSEKVICSSDFVKNDFLRKYFKKTTTITPGVDLNLFKPSKYNLRNEILFVGSINKSEEYKSLEVLIKSILNVKSNIKDIKLIIVGSGDLVNYYKELIKKLDLRRNIIFTGNLYGNKLVKTYQSSNILILPSTKESFGMVLIEAMACKKPVIGSDIEGIPYVIDNGKDGLLVPPRNPKKLAEAIIKILKDPRLAKQMGENGYKKVKENFTLDTQINKMNEILKNLK